MKLVNRPCPTCKEDTLHVGRKCNRCGYIHASPGAVYKAARLRQIRKVTGNAARRGMPYAKGGIAEDARMAPADFWRMVNARRAERAKAWDEKKQRMTQFTPTGGDKPLFDRSTKARNARYR